MRNIAYSSEEIALDFVRIELKKEFPGFIFVVTPPKEGDEKYRLVCMDVDSVDVDPIMERAMVEFARGYNAALNLMVKH